MGTLTSFIMTTLDGFFEGPNGEFDFWADASDEFDTFSTEQLDAADTLVFGRTTYDGMAGYWPTADAIRDNPTSPHFRHGRVLPYHWVMVDRATIFGSEAARYDAVRPRYPASVIDLVVGVEPDVAVDAGCGTGIASMQVAERGVRVVGVEPDARMAAVAQGRGINVAVSSFEQWDVEPCDAVFAAQSWHWIDPIAGAKVAARSIRPGGQWIAFWNHEIDARLDEVIVPVYEHHAPHLVEERSIAYAGREDFAARIGEGLAAMRAFAPMTVEHVDWVDEIDGTTFVERLDSHSSHRLLDDSVRSAVRDALLEAVGDTTRLDVAYLTEVFSCERRG